MVPSLALSYSLYESARGAAVAWGGASSRSSSSRTGSSGNDAETTAACSSSSSGNAFGAGWRGDSNGTSSSGDSSGSRRYNGDDPVRQALREGRALDPGDQIALQVGVSSCGREVVDMSSWTSTADAVVNAASQSQGMQYVRKDSDSCSSSSRGESGEIMEASSSGRESSSSGSGGVVGTSQPQIPAAVSLACGCVSGFLTSTVTFPLDVVRRRMQVSWGSVLRVGGYGTRLP